MGQLIYEVFYAKANQICNYSFTYKKSTEGFHFCERLTGFLLNFQIQWKKDRCKPRNRCWWALTNRNHYDIVLYYVSMAEKPLSQPKC